MLKLKLQYFGHLMQRVDSLEKTLMLGKIEGWRRRDNRGWDGWMASLTRWRWALRGGDGLGGLAYCGSWATKSQTWLSDWTELNAMNFIYWMLNCKPAFLLSSFTFIKSLLSSSSLSAIGWCHLHIWGYWYFSWQSWFQLVLHPAQRFSWHTLHIS